mmetsp:Transcript_114215/g.198012  ORF Transcript_114215/g.198012 Transcript_114215/m.198012 type:complete len:470 (-) Transcript_114215:295-1704(-)
MASSMMRATALLLLCFSANGAPVTEQGNQHTKEEMTVSVPMIVKLEQETRIVEDGKDKKQFYSAMLSVGGPKPQQFRMGFDLGGGTTLLPSKDCTQKACVQRKQYNKWDSNLAEDVQRDGKRVTPGSAKVTRKRFLARDVGTLDFTSIELGDGKAKGFFVRDKVCMDEVNETRCFSLAFLAARQMSEDPFHDEPYDGIVGLGPGTGGILSNDFDFVYSLTHALPGNTQRMFGLYLGHGKGGEIAFGGYDPRRLSSPVTWAPIANVDEGRWQVVISAIRVGNSTLDACSGNRCLAALDHGTSLLGVPSELENQLEKQISAAGPRHCEKSNIPDLQLEINGMTLTVPVQDYSPSTVAGPFNNDPCLPNLEVQLDQTLSPGNHVFILGESILRRYYTIYDTDSNRIGFSKAKDDEDESLGLRDDMSEAMPSSKKDNYVVLLVQVKVTSRKTKSSLGLIEDTPFAEDIDSDNF